MNAEVMSAIRSIVKILGASAAAYGVGTGSDWEAVAGAVVTIAGFAWSLWVAHKSKKEVPSA